MAIFQREETDSPQDSSPAPRRQPAPQQSSGQTTVVAAGSKIRGEIAGGTDVLIHGEVEGQLSLSSSVIVGEHGVVEGRIQARRVRVSGKVLGDIRASERIEVLESGSIEGDVVAPRVAINAGAFFKGKVEMAPEAKSAKPTGADQPTGGQAAGRPSAPPSPGPPSEPPAKTPPKAAAEPK